MILKQKELKQLSTRSSASWEDLKVRLEYQRTITTQKACQVQVDLPMLKRADIVRLIGNRLQQHKRELGSLISLETGKIQAESEGEVQEFKDICDYAVGLSRMISGSDITSERPKHKLFEMWNPIGLIGIITTYNYPAAVYGWNAAIAMVCGDTLIWKGAPTTPLTSIAVTKLVQAVLADNKLPGGISTLVSGGATLATPLRPTPGCR